MTEDELDPKQGPNDDRMSLKLANKNFRQELASLQEYCDRITRDIDQRLKLSRLAAEVLGLRNRQERLQKSLSKEFDFTPSLVLSKFLDNPTSHLTFDKAFTFKRQNPRGQPKFSEALGEQIGALSEERFPQLSKRLNKSLKDESAQALVLILSALIDQGLRNILFCILCIEIGCDTNVTRKHMEDYRVSTANFVKDCKAALQTTNRQVKTRREPVI